MPTPMHMESDTTKRLIGEWSWGIDGTESDTWHITRAILMLAAEVRDLKERAFAPLPDNSPAGWEEG